MIKSRAPLILAVIGVSITVFAAQVALPGILANHLKALQEAQTLNGTLTVQPLPGSPKTIKFSYSKPNLFKIDNEDGFVLSDGQNIYTYTKSSNKYTVEPMTEGVLDSKAGMSDVWAWAAFFNKDAFKDVVAKAGGSRVIKGNKVTEVMVEWQKPTVGSATLYVDDKSGFARGCSIKNGDNESIVMAESLEIGKEPGDKQMFVWAAPSGATQVETVVATPMAGWAAVQGIFKKSCMPCHSSVSRKAGIDLSSYEAVVGNSEAVVAGEPDRSGVYRTTKGSRPSMPRSGAPLTSAEVQTIYDWIKAGAKKE